MRMMMGLRLFVFILFIVEAAATLSLDSLATKEDLKVLQFKIEEQQKKIEEQDGEIKVLQESRKDRALMYLERHLQILQSKLEEQQRETEAQQKKNEAQQKKTEALQEKIEAQHNRKQGRTPSVSFRATFKEWTSTFGGRVVLRFDDVYVNNGNGYSGNSGIFRAPVSGLYVFTVSIFSESRITCMMLKDGNFYKSLGWLTVNPYETGSIQAVAHLQKGQTVSVLKFENSNDVLHGYNQSNFNGILVRADDNSLA